MGRNERLRGGFICDASPCSQIVDYAVAGPGDKDTLRNMIKNLAAIALALGVSEDVSPALPSCCLNPNAGVSFLLQSIGNG